MINIDFKPSPKQALAWLYLHDETTTEIGYGGAASGGKSWLICIFILITCVKYPGVAFGLGRKELVTLKRTTLRTLFKVFTKYNLKKGVHYKYNTQESTITFANGSIIFLLDLAYKPSDPLYTRFGGLELTHCAIDESNENDLQAIKILKTRIARCNNDKYNLKPKFIESFNPDKGHVFSRFWEPFKKKLLPYYRKFIRALPTDNPYTTQDYIQELERADPITKERLLNGNFDYDESLNKLFKYKKILDLFYNSFIQNGSDKYITCDCAEWGADKIVIVLWFGLRVKKIIVLDKSKYKKNEDDLKKETAELIKKIALENNVPNSNICIDDDGVGKGVTTHIPNCYKFHNAEKALNDENYKSLQDQCLFYLADYTNDNLIYIEPDALVEEGHKERLIRELDVNKRKNADFDGKLEVIDKKEIKKLITGSPDFRDALMMRMVYEILNKMKPFNPSMIVIGKRRI